MAEWIGFHGVCTKWSYGDLGKAVIIINKSINPQLQWEAIPGGWVHDRANPALHVNGSACKGDRRDAVGHRMKSGSHSRPR